MKTPPIKLHTEEISVSDRGASLHERKCTNINHHRKHYINANILQT